MIANGRKTARPDRIAVHVGISEPNAKRGFIMREYFKLCNGNK
jgi:hypothetical protein